MCEYVFIQVKTFWRIFGAGDIDLKEKIQKYKKDIDLKEKIF